MAEQNPYKRAASPVAELPMPPAKVARTTNQLQINYLKREKKETIPLATTEESLPRLLRLMGEYEGVLQRHESLAGNLGACPVGPILLKRFERLFEGPPRILKSNSRDPNISWLDVVEFAQNKPEQFDLEKTRNGVRVCQFYLKQCRVEITEEDYVLIRSGMPQKLIPPQPILEDEEKELGVIDVLDRNLGKVIHSADQVSARARQLVHRLKTRRSAILARREADLDTTRTVLRSNDLPASPALANNGVPSQQTYIHTPPQPQLPPQPTPPHVPSTSHQHYQYSTAPAPIPTTQSPSVAGFTAVNPRHSLPPQDSVTFPSVIPQSQQGYTQSLNGTPLTGQSQPIDRRSDRLPDRDKQESWMDRFLTPDERAAGMTADTVRRSIGGSATIRSNSQDVQMADDPPRSSTSRRSESRRQSDIMASENPILDVQTPSVPIPHTPASLIPAQKLPIWNRDDGGPLKVEMIARMETMKRGERVVPPCDRCRRLHMDCIKNLTACLGCTKKHAKCAWKDVSVEELEDTAPEAEARAAKAQQKAGLSSSGWDSILRSGNQDSDSEHPSPVKTELEAEPERDLERRPESRSRESPSRIPSPVVAAPAEQRSASTSKPPSRGPGSPQFDLRPPPLEQQLREAAEDHPSVSYARFSSLNRPRTEEPTLEDSDRLAAVAAQVYRTASQNATRSSDM